MNSSASFHKGTLIQGTHHNSSGQRWQGICRYSVCHLPGHLSVQLAFVWQLQVAAEQAGTQESPRR